MLSKIFLFQNCQTPVEAIHYALYSGVKGIFTMHGRSVEDIKNNKQIYELIENREIQKVVFL